MPSIIRNGVKILGGVDVGIRTGNLYCKTMSFDVEVTQYTSAWLLIFTRYNVVLIKAENNSKGAVAGVYKYTLAGDDSYVTVSNNGNTITITGPNWNWYSWINPNTINPTVSAQVSNFKIITKNG